MAPTTRVGPRLRELQPVWWVPSGGRPTIRDHRYAHPALDACDAEPELRVGARHLRRGDSPVALATEAEGDADKHEDEPPPAGTLRDSEAIQGRSAAHAVGDHAR